MSTESTPVFQEPRITLPEQLPPPEVANVPELVTQLDKVSALANNGHIKKITRENFPDIPKNELTEIRFLAYSTRISRLTFIATKTSSELIRASCVDQIKKLTQKRDKEFEKNYGKMLTGLPVKNEESAIPPQRREPPSTGQYL